MSRILLTLFFLQLCFSHYGQGREMTLLQLEKDRFKAMINRDSAFLEKVLADDLVYIHSNGLQDTKQTFISSIMNRKMEYLSIDFLQADVRTNNQTAWIHGGAKVKVRTARDTAQVEFSIRYLDVYKREDGGWKLVAWQSARLN